MGSSWAFACGRSGLVHPLEPLPREIRWDGTRERSTPCFFLREPVALVRLDLLQCNVDIWDRTCFYDQGVLIYS